MKYSIRKNWLDTFGIIAKTPEVLMPFIIIAFIETLALELIFFSPRYPIAAFFNPIIRKFFGEAFLHYPGNLMILPKLFYFAQVAIYILGGVLLASVTVNIVKNVREGLPIKANALMKNGLRRYASFFAYALAVTIIMALVGKADDIVLGKGFRFLGRTFPAIPSEIFLISTIIAQFIINVVVQIFIVLCLPIIVIYNRSFVKAFLKSLIFGAKNFFSIFGLILLPFVLYLPVLILRAFSEQLIAKVSPEMTAVVTLAGIVAALFLDCFVMVSVSNLILDRKEEFTR